MPTRARSFTACVRALKQARGTAAKRRALCELVHHFPIRLDTLVDHVEACFDALNESRVDGLALADIGNGQVVGSMLDRMIARRCAQTHPQGAFHMGATKREKDVVCGTDDRMSFEVKTSGQRGRRDVHGNRNYGRGERIKVRSGFSLFVNYEKRAGRLYPTLIRFGWVFDAQWQAQRARTGQAARLPRDVYQTQLLVLPGSYMQHASGAILRGVGPTNAAYDRTIHDLAQQTPPQSTLGKKIEAYLSSSFSD